MNNLSIKISSVLIAFCLSIFISFSVLAQDKNSVPIELYALDGGRLDFKNMGIFYDTGEHEGEAGYMAVPCNLIHHGKDWMLWDTGNGDDMIKEKNGVNKIGIHFSVKKTLKSQLAELSLKPNDIKFVVLSHLHPDHTGNIKLFPNAELIVSQYELDWAFGKPKPSSI